MQWQRLSLIVNNARFLILPGIRIPNLASKVLSLNVKRVSDDWDRVHGHPVFLAETFVDTARFTGACYKAANWQYLGHTRGYRKNARERLSDPTVGVPVASTKVATQVGVTQADALHTQKELARFLVEDKQADYCLTVKDNQASIKEDIAYLRLNEGFPPQHERVDKGHGRLETRRIWTSTEPPGGLHRTFSGKSENRKNKPGNRLPDYQFISRTR